MVFTGCVQVSRVRKRFPLCYRAVVTSPSSRCDMAGHAATEGWMAHPNSLMMFEIIRNR
ncbi:hypothetical protein BRADO6933 [Bradyrhizobium sp. ORS 278]|nr:hypothetical protein BRADO6933 [Bradyrhizobium sp. ORS 278]